MEQIIKVKSASYKRYEELLIKKENLVKEALGYKAEFEAIFETLSKEVQAAKMDCVRKRKIISYCKTMLSGKKSIVRKELESFVDKAMKEYEDTLVMLSSEEETEKEKIEVSEDNKKKIKTTYHQLAKLIHPDTNPDLKDDVVIQDLWNRTCIAYNCSNLEELEELVVLINRYLESSCRKHLDLEIPDINEKIFNLNREIYRITHSTPYDYKYVLENKEEVNKKREELQTELNDYQRYIDELDQEISQYEPIIIE